MTKKRTPVTDGRKPKHSLDAARLSKGGKGRDAATVSGCQGGRGREG